MQRISITSLILPFIANFEIIQTYIVGKSVSIGKMNVLTVIFG